MDVQVTVVGGVAVAVVGGWLVYYLNALLQRRSDYRSLKEKVDSVAGKQATVLWEGKPYRIESFDRRGLVLHSKKQTVFIPTAAVLQRPLVVPTDDYAAVLADEERETRERSRAAVREIANDMIDEFLPRMMGRMKDELIDEGTEINAVIGLQIRKALDEKGFTVQRSIADASKAPPTAKRTPRRSTSG